MKKVNRRRFLKAGLFAGASLNVLPPFGADAQTDITPAPHARVVGANGDIRYAVCGFNSRGQDHLKEMRAVKGVRLVALCDVDRKVLDREVQKARAANQTVEGYTDVRKLLESKEVDAVTFATPNHWHSLGAIWAIQAGKDVYVEKPVSHNVWEGRQLVAAARKHDRIVQPGTQVRSNPGVIEAIAWVREGHIGKILRARGLCYKRRASIGKVTEPTPIPPEIDYDLWCGPAPKGPLMRKKLHYDWHWVWPTGCGDLGNQGIHQVDIARWVLGETQLSPRVLSMGGRLGYVDDGATPNTLVVFHDYPAAPLIFEVRGLPEKTGTEKMDNYHGASIGVVVDCEGGRLVIPSYTTATAFDSDGKELKKFNGGASHFANFIDAVRSRNRTDLHADILEGHISSALCHTGNISYRLGGARPPEEIRDSLKDNKDMTEAFGRMQEHLAVNDVNLSQTPATLGVALAMDPRSERFIDNADANQMLTREYRKPFVVPEMV